ncbi:putative trans-acting enoyl reductase [Diplonema papillatum]|nr:putative trans-acting enoyl reductase [Diplonema papillatum]
MSGTPLWVRDGKRLPLDSTLVALANLGLLAAAAPLLGMLCVTSIGLAVAKAVLFPTPKAKKPAEGDELRDVTKKPFQDRKFDIVILGATGFTGTRAVRHVAKEYAAGEVKWAIAGRRKDALDAVRKSVGLPDLAIIVCDVTKPETLHDLVRDTRAVVSTAGPFTVHGTEVVKFCASYGTHYADSTGEVDWVREMVDRFDGIARRSGARIVNCCGNDSVPWDLSLWACAQELKKAAPDNSVAEIECFNRSRAVPSGGTLASVFATLNPPYKYTSSAAFDPMLIDNGEKSWARVVSRIWVLLSYARRENAWATLSLMAPPNARVISRSNAILKYGESLVYKEVSIAPSLPAALAAVGNIFAVVCVLWCTPLTWLLRRYVLHKPGSGPTEAEMDAGFLDVTCFAKGTKPGSLAKSRMYFATDPFYRETGRMVAEAGLALALADEKFFPGGHGGVLTTASGIGGPYLERLIKTGTQFSVETVQ